MGIIEAASACNICADKLPHGPRPVFVAHPEARILLVGQAPGRKVHASGIPWDDMSGKRLRAWLGVSSEVFYDPACFAMLPMGFCYPGTGKSGDLPPRPECAPTWHHALRALMPNIVCTLLIGQYAQAWYLGERKKENLTKTVQAWAEYLPDYCPLPHPSPRNQIWEKKNPWFAETLLPELQKLTRMAAG